MPTLLFNGIPVTPSDHPAHIVRQHPRIGQRLADSRQPKHCVRPSHTLASRLFHALHSLMKHLRDVLKYRCDTAVIQNHYTTPEVTSQEEEWQLRQ
jgi:hypothetical protein